MADGASECDSSDCECDLFGSARGSCGVYSPAARSPFGRAFYNGKLLMPALESAGVIVRMPASWRMNRPAWLEVKRLEVKGTVGGKAPSQVGMDALLDFRTEVTLDGETLSAAEIEWLLAQSDGLAFMRGRWIEVDRERLSRTLEQFE